ncbi:DNA repair protein RAD51 homolog 2 [Linum perenne]
MLQIGATCFPEIFKMKTMAKEMAGRILVLRPGSLHEFTESLQQIKVSVLQRQVKLLVIDSMAALVSGESEQRGPRKHALGWHISFLKSLAEFSRIPVVVTNQVRSQSRDAVCQHKFEVHSKDVSLDGAQLTDSHLVAALGVHWAHAVTIRLILEANLGQRFLKVSKSPISPPLAFPFRIESSGILLLDDTGRELSGHEINTIHCQGHSDIIYFDGGTIK